MGKEKKFFRDDLIQPSKEEAKEYYRGRIEYFKGASRNLRDCKYELMEMQKILKPCECVTKGMTEEQKSIIEKLLASVMDIAIDTIESYVIKAEQEIAEATNELKVIN